MSASPPCPPGRLSVNWFSNDDRSAKHPLIQDGRSNVVVGDGPTSKWLDHFEGVTDHARSTHPSRTSLSHCGLITMDGPTGLGFARPQVGALSALAANEESVADIINVAASSF